MSYDDFLHKVNEMHRDQPHKGYLRLGQIFFNELLTIKPALAEELRGSMLDPFFKERITQVTSDFVRERWHSH